VGVKERYLLEYNDTMHYGIRAYYVLMQCFTSLLQSNRETKTIIFPDGLGWRKKVKVIYKIVAPLWPVGMRLRVLKQRKGLQRPPGRKPLHRGN
jgi:hypothetical protein